MSRFRVNQRYQPGSLRLVSRNIGNYPINTNAAGIREFELFDAQNQVKNGAVLFFASEPQKQFEKAFTRCVLYDGEDKRFIADDKRFNGPLYNQYLESLRWLKGKLNVRYDIEGQDSDPARKSGKFRNPYLRKPL